jgi:non-specific serine/threonine protein kinase
MLEEYPGGVWFVDFARIADPTLLPQAVGLVLGVREQSGSLLLDTLIDHLRPLEVLLVLDNCEHLIEASAELANKLLHTCPRLRIIATSREALGIDGEVSFCVPSLSRPDPRLKLPAEELAHYEAVQLFIERARLKRPDFKLTPQNAPAVAELCSRLDGIPLAIELAAARIMVLSVEQLVDRLSERFRLLTSGNQAAMPRHQTLRALVDWSYDLLTDEERALLRTLSVFAGGFSLEAVEEVCRSLRMESEIIDVLAHLVDKSLVDMREWRGEARYEMLETIRQYAWEKLEELGEVESARVAHLAWFLKLAEQAEAEFRGPEQVAWTDRLEVEHDNLRAALRWAQESKNPEAGLRIAGALWRFWGRRDYLSEGRGWLEATLALAHAFSRERTPTEARVLSGAGIIAWCQGDFPAAHSLLADSAATCRELGDGWGSAQALSYLGLVALFEGNHEAARSLGEESLAIFRVLGDEWGIALALSNLGRVLYQLGDYVRARSLNEEGLAIFRAVGDRWGTARTLNNLGEIARLQGDFIAAQVIYEESLEVWRKLGHKVGIAWALHNLGYVAQHRGDYRLMEQLFRDSLALYREAGDKQGIAMCVAGLAGVVRAAVQPEWATRLLGAADALLEAIGAHLWPADRMEYDRHVAAVRAYLNENAFEAAWAEGRAMSLEQVVALAELTPVLPPRAAMVRSQGRDDMHDLEIIYPADLTPREVEVLRLVAAGLTSQQMAKQLYLSPHTVHAHLHSIYGKIGVRSRSAAARFAVENNLT